MSHQKDIVYYTQGTLFPDDAEPNVLWFDKDGKQSSNDKQVFFGKIVSDDNTDTHYVRMEANGMISDPLKDRIRSTRTDLVKWKKVKKSIFDFYMVYLNTKNPIYLTKAQRGFIDG